LAKAFVVYSETMRQLRAQPRPSNWHRQPRENLISKRLLLIFPPSSCSRLGPARFRFSTTWFKLIVSEAFVLRGRWLMLGAESFIMSDFIYRISRTRTSRRSRAAAFAAARPIIEFAIALPVLFNLVLGCGHFRAGSPIPKSRHERPHESGLIRQSASYNTTPYALAHPNIHTLVDNELKTHKLQHEPVNAAQLRSSRTDARWPEAGAGPKWTYPFTTLVTWPFHTHQILFSARRKWRFKSAESENDNGV